MRLRTGLTIVLFFLTLGIAQDYYSGISTHFVNFGDPYGGCGVPFDALENPNYVALNAFNTPKMYQPFPTRPPMGDPNKLGMYQDGCNCGRYVEVIMGADCVGAGNGGEPNSTPCGSGTWKDDKYSNSKLIMMVADECTDGNAWCRDVPYHLDLATLGLNKFIKTDGTPTGDMYPTHFNNRQIKWRFIEAPNYTGDIKIFFVKNAKKYWPAIMINRLRNGIHAVEQKIGDKWEKCERVGHLGQQFVLKDGVSSKLTIRVLDAFDKYINGGQEYIFSFPPACGDECTKNVTEVSYTTAGGSTAVHSTKILNSKRLSFSLLKNAGGISIKYDVPVMGMISVQLFDMKGRQHYSSNELVSANGSGFFSVSNLSAGIYCLRVKNSAYSSDALVMIP
jgi:hypothetical protein